MTYSTQEAIPVDVNVTMVEEVNPLCLFFPLIDKTTNR